MKKIIKLSDFTSEKITKVFEDCAPIRCSNSKPDLKMVFEAAKDIFLNVFNLNECEFELLNNKENLIDGFKLSNPNNVYGMYKQNNLRVWMIDFSIYTSTCNVDYCDFYLEVYFDPVKASDEDLDELIYIGDLQHQGHFMWSKNEEGYCMGLGCRGVADNNLELIRETLLLKRFYQELSCVQRILNSEKA